MELDQDEGEKRSQSKLSVEELLSFYRSKQKTKRVDFKRKPRMHYFADTAKSYYESIHNDENRRKEFREAYLKGSQKTNNTEEPCSQQNSRNLKRKEIRKAKRAFQVLPERKSERSSSRSQKSGSVRFDQEVFMKEIQVVEIKGTTSVEEIMISDSDSVELLTGKAMKSGSFISSSSEEKYHSSFSVSEIPGEDFQLIESDSIELVENESFYLSKLSPYDRTLLKIQEKIDKYLIFNDEVRARRSVFLHRLIDYLVDSENHLFNKDMFLGLMQLNPDLYTTKQGMSRCTLLVSGNNLKDQNIRERVSNTLKKMLGRASSNSQQDRSQVQVLELSQPPLPKIFQDQKKKRFDPFFDAVLKN